MKNIDKFSLQVSFTGWAIMIVLLTFGLMSCSKKAQDIVPSNDDSANDVVKNMNELVISPDFKFSTTEYVNLKVTAKDKSGTAIKGVVFSIMDKDPQINTDAKIIATGITASNGVYENKITVPSYIKKLTVVPNYIGLIDVMEGEIINSSVEFDLGVKATSKAREVSSYFKNGARTEATTLSFLGTWNSLGVPNYLEAVNDIVDASFLADVNNALPELRPVPTYHPEYINTSNETDIVLNDSADVWVTFVHEGAGWRNALGFYSYDIANPPTSVAQITKHTIIFPNVSYQGSGGGLASGNKVKIGTFSKNTGIGWFIVANGWNGSTVGTGNYTHYSEPNFNIEPNASLKSHMVLLKNDVRNRVLIGFEDVRRDNSGCDNDFNDAIFYVTANPYTSIKTQNVVSMPTLTDSDNDGISNAFDQYPSDPQRGFESFFPSKTSFGSLCFEDLWPGKGDYDFNDLVINYNFSQVMNGQNQLIDLKAKFVVKAIGASYKNGFGFQLPIPSANIASVNGNVKSGNLISYAANGVEEGQEKATIIVFDNPESTIKRTGGSYYNTETSFAKGTSDTISITVTFTTPVNASDLGAIPYNPFIFINQNRGMEVHLIDKQPTSLASTSVLGTSDDMSSVSNNKYYKTKTNLPFAINIPADFDYPIEKSPIVNAHLKFGNWAESGGATFSDWYLNNTNYRDIPKIYKK